MRSKEQSLQWISKDGVGVAILGVAATLRGISYLPSQVNPNRNPAHVLETVAAPTTWSWLWLAVGIFCLASTMAERIRPMAAGSAISLHFLWAASFVVYNSWGWVTTIAYTTISLLAIWGFARGRQHSYKEVPECREEP